MGWNRHGASYFTIDFAFVVVLGAIALFSSVVFILGITGIKTNW